MDLAADRPTLAVTCTLVVQLKGQGIVRQDSTKSAAGRHIVYLPRFAVEVLLHRQSQEQPNTNNAVFATRNGTWASAVWELHGTDPGMSRGQLYGRAMRIRRDRIAPTVCAIAFAYLGAALPLLLIVALLKNSFIDTLTSGQIAEEVVRTLVGSIGLVLAIPITTAVAVLAVSADDPAAQGARSAPVDVSLPA